MKKQPNGSHLSLSDRTIIETSLNQGFTFKDIALLLCKDPTTISKEIRKHRVWKEGSSYGTKNSCIYVRDCRKKNVCAYNCDVICSKKRNCRCFLRCEFYEAKSCSNITAAPYVCNGCEKKSGCRLDKYYYRAQNSYDEYRSEIVSSRQGVNLSKEELNRVDTLISPLIKNGQPISHIYEHMGHDIPFCQRTLYNHVKNEVLSVKSIDLARKVRYKPRKERKEPAKDRSYRIGHTYSDFGKYMALNPDTRIVEMDTVIGASGSGKVLLTMLFRWINLMLVFLMPDKSQESVCKVFENLKQQLGSETFKDIFPLFLTDNGSEFMNWTEFLSDENGEILSEIFFCNPNASYQKGRIEKNHEYLRYIVPKGTSFANLTDDKVTLMMNHINSTARPSLGGETPMKLGLMLLPTRFFEVLGLEMLTPEKVILKPALLKTL